MKISVVVPVYNSSSTLPLLAKEIEAALSTAADAFELILVNDGSPDNCWEVIQGLAKTYHWAYGINLIRNYGQHNATLCGIREARYDVVAILDDDMQNPPHEIPKLLDKLQEGYDIVYGISHKREQIWWKRLASTIVKNSISYVMGLRSVRNIGAFKVFRTDIRKSFSDYQGPDILVDVLLSWGASRYAFVTVDEAPRMSGESNYNFFKLIKVSFLMLTSFTTIPLRFASIVGFIFTIFGVGILAYVLLIYVTQESVEGFTFLAATITIFSGVQLFALGIIGEYLARVFERTGDKPAYIVRNTTNERNNNK